MGGDTVRTTKDRTNEIKLANKEINLNIQSLKIHNLLLLIWKDKGTL